MADRARLSAGGLDARSEECAYTSLYVSDERRSRWAAAASSGDGSPFLVSALRLATLLAPRSRSASMPSDLGSYFFANPYAAWRVEEIDVQLVVASA